MILKFIQKERILFYWFIVAICIITTRLFLLNKKEFFPFGAEIGNTLASFSIGYIISYIFYFLVVFRKSQKDRKNVSDFLVEYLSYLTIQAYRDFNGLKMKSQIKTLMFPPSEDELVAVFRKLDPVNSLCNKSSGGRYNWYDYLKFVLVETANKYIAEVWQLLPYLDTELIRILNSLKESYMFRAAWGISREIIPIDQSRINVHKDRSIPSRVAEYFKIINELENYLSENFNEYKEFATQRHNELYSTYKLATDQMRQSDLTRRKAK